MVVLDQLMLLPQAFLSPRPSLPGSDALIPSERRHMLPTCYVEPLDQSLNDLNDVEGDDSIQQLTFQPTEYAEAVFGFEE